MAIVICPKCGKRTSSVDTHCRSCGGAVDSGDVETNIRQVARARKARARKLSMQAVLATILGTSAGLWLMFGEAPRAGGAARWLAVILFVAGLGWYVYARLGLWLQRKR